jgi:hypothetical protein
VPSITGDAVHQPLALGNAAAARAVHADRVDLVDIGHRAVLVADVADLGDRAMSPSIE